MANAMRHKHSLQNTALYVMDIRHSEVKWWLLPDTLKLVNIGLIPLRASGKQLRVMLW